MGFEDIVNKGKEFVQGGVEKAKGLIDDNKDKVDGVIHSEQAEGVSDSVLDGVAGFAKKVLPDSVDGKIDEIRGNIDKSVGNE